MNMDLYTLVLLKYMFGGIVPRNTASHRIDFTLNNFTQKRAWNCPCYDVWYQTNDMVIPSFKVGGLQLSGGPER